MRLLILGGTADGRLCANALHPHMEVLYSVAGLVRTPAVACEVVSGGFTSHGGLASYVSKNGIDALLDITHPYAQRMSTAVNLAAQECNIPCWRFHRPAWVPERADHWIEFSSTARLVVQLSGYTSVLWSAGQLDADTLSGLISLAPETCIVLRTAVRPPHEIPANMQWLKAIGPFNLVDEQALMQRHNIDAIVSKNSGGESTVAKLQAARLAGIPVYMQKRPDMLAADKIFTDIDSCCEYVIGQVRPLTS